LSCVAPSGWDSLNPIKQAQYAACLANQAAGTLGHAGTQIGSGLVNFELGQVKIAVDRVNQAEQGFSHVIQDVNKGASYVYKAGDFVVDLFRSGGKLVDTGSKTLDDTKSLIDSIKKWIDSGGNVFPSWPNITSLTPGGFSDISSLNSKLDALGQSLTGSGSTSTQSFDPTMLLVFGGVAAVILIVAFLVLRKRK